MRRQRSSPAADELPADFRLTMVAAGPTARWYVGAEKPGDLADLRGMVRPEIKERGLSWGKTDWTP